MPPGNAYTRTTTDPSRWVRAVHDGLAVTLKSRTSVATQVEVRPFVATRRPLVASRIVRSVVILTRTDGLVTVTNGSPWFGRSNGVARLIHGSQR